MCMIENRSVWYCKPLNIRGIKIWLTYWLSLILAGSLKIDFYSHKGYSHRGYFYRKRYDPDKERIFMPPSFL